MKHVEVTQMWLQGHVASGKIRFRQVPREQNTADAFTKHWTSDAAKHFAGISFEAFPESTARAVDEKKMHFHDNSQIAKLPG